MHKKYDRGKRDEARGQLPPERAKTGRAILIPAAPLFGEDLKILEYAGILYRKEGYGLYIRDISATDPIGKLNFALTTTSKTINELMELRISLEADAAYCAAIRRDENDLLALEKAITKMREIHLKDRSDKGMQMLQHESLNFHRAIMEATKTPFCKAFMANCSACCSSLANI